MRTHGCNTVVCNARNPNSNGVQSLGRNSVLNVAIASVSRSACVGTSSKVTSQSHWLSPYMYVYD